MFLAVTFLHFLKNAKLFRQVSLQFTTLLREDPHFFMRLTIRSFIYLIMPFQTVGKQVFRSIFETPGCTTSIIPVGSEVKVFLLR